MSGWQEFLDGKSIGMIGTESGILVADLEHPGGARISLERDCETSPWAVTCGIYDWMVHTAFFPDEQSARTAFEAMKDRLAAMLDPGMDQDRFHDEMNRLVADF